MNIPSSVWLLAFAVFLVWLTLPWTKKKPKVEPRPRIKPPIATVLNDTSGYYILDGEPGQRALAHWKNFEFVSDARSFIKCMNGDCYQGKLHVGYWNGENWEQFFDA